MTAHEQKGRRDVRVDSSAAAIRDRADRYEYALTLLHNTGDGGFVVLTRDEQQVVADAITAAVAHRKEANRGA